MAEIYIDSSLSESNQKSDVEPLVVRLRRWYSSSHANLTQLKMLLTELKPDHPDLPLDPRCIVLTPVYVNIKALNNGSYIHVGIKQGLVKRMVNGIKPNCLQLDIEINIDGLPISKSSSVDVWPILGRCIGLYDQRPFVIGLFCGSGKPEPLDLYLKDFIDELKVLQNDGINYNHQIFRVFIKCLICDAPARAYLKCIKHHSGYNGCERCIQEGEHDGAKVKKILKSENGIVLIADVCNDLHDFFEIPIKSSKVGIWKLEYLYAVVEFPPDNTGEKPQAAIVLKSWLLPNKKCWWPCHLKSDIAIQKALISKQEPGEGYMKCDFLRNLE
ncbi:transposase domain-containing protein [Lasius niger]|uniref:Tpa: transposase domain-containing protein n=1 Tax=Lasius niger TaxID=67767 RepID=A0A0J7K9G8_LASNI|nr:transposase domain-containing protein [Lasius niger]